MTIVNKDEYKLASGQTISIQQRSNDGVWEVACSNSDDSLHWYLEFPFGQMKEAKAEFERWK